MANRILIKRSSTNNNIPSTSALSLGELAINTYNGRLFAKKDDGSASVIDLTRNDPIRVLGDATSTYDWDQSTYTSNVTVTLNDTGVTANTYGGVTNGVVKVPKVTVDSKGRVTNVEVENFSAAANLGTIATQDADNVEISGGTIDGTVIGATTAADGTFANVTVNGKFYSNDITATSVSVDGDAIITGNLTVQGVTTTVNSTTVAIGDLNIELAKDATTAAQANGAGITVKGPATAATITYNGTNNRWDFNKTIRGNVNIISGADIIAGGALSSGGDFAVATDKFTVNATTGDTSVAGTLGVTGAATLSDDLTVAGVTTLNDALTVNASATATGLLNADGGIAVGTNKFTVDSTTGDTVVAGTLDVTGLTTVDDLTVTGTTSFDTIDTTGAVGVGGSLTVDGAATIAQALDVTGRVTVGGVTGSSNAFGLVFANASNQLETDTDLTYNATTDTLTIKNVSITGTASIAGLSAAGVSQTQVIYGGSGGAFKGESTFTYDDSTDTLSVANATLSGDVSAGGDLTVTGNGSVGGTLDASGDFAVATNKFTVAAASGNTDIAGTFNADGNATLGGTLDVTGATSVGGTLSSTGNFAVNTNKFTVTASNGNTSTAGTLGVAGATTLSNTLDVTGAASFAAAVSMTANAGATLGNYATGTLKVTGDASVNGVLQVSGAIYKAGFEVINTTDTIDGGSF